MPFFNQILKTKFHVPKLPVDFVFRERLSNKLDDIFHNEVVLISAPTGYGKSTILTSWLKKQTVNYAWLSLSEQENNLQQFILYFTYAIKEKIINFNDEIIELVTAPEKLSAKILIDHFLNALAELDQPFILVLDDYHLVRNAEVNHFISRLFEYQQPYFRLIISTRRDPNLPLFDWRLKNRLVDIRAKDLSFTRSEIITFLKKFTNNIPEEDVLNSIEKVSEGWITGLRLFILSVDKMEELSQRYMKREMENFHIFDQLVKDILNRQSPVNRNYLLKLSLLDEFNEELFYTICEERKQKLSNLNSFTEFIEMLSYSNMFIISLDERHNWYRFHHLFKDMLARIARQELSNETRIKILDSAASWLLENQLIGQAIEYSINAGKYEKAVAAFSQIRTELLSRSLWMELEQIFSLFPDNLADKYSMLSLTRGWLHIYKGNIPEMIANIDPTEELILSESFENEERDNFIGEIETMRAWARYFFNIDMEKCLWHSRNAIEKLASANTYPMGVAWIFYGASMQTQHMSSEGKKKIYETLYSSKNASLTSNLLLILCYIEWLEGNLVSLKRTSMQLVTFGEKENHKEAQANGWYFYGMAVYFMNEDHEALNAFKKLYELRHFTLQVHSFFGILGLAYILVELGNIDEAEAYFEELEKSAMERGGPVYIHFARAFIAEFNFLSRQKKSGLMWAKEISDLDLLPMSNFSSPQLAQIRILAEDDNPESWEYASQIMEKIIPFLEKYNNSNFLIRVLALYSFVSYKQGKRIAACDTLERVFALSEPRGFVRTFTDLGSQMSEMLKECRQKKRHMKYIDDLLYQMTVAEHQTKEELLTSREIQVLQLLGNQLSNKEVGNKLFISEATVKRHVANIFKKLNVVSRKEALIKTKEMELIK